MDDCGHWRYEYIRWGAALPFDQQQERDLGQSDRDNIPVVRGYLCLSLVQAVAPDAQCDYWRLDDNGRGRPDHLSQLVESGFPVIGCDTMAKVCLDQACTNFQ